MRSVPLVHRVARALDVDPFGMELVRAITRADQHDPAAQLRLGSGAMPVPGVLTAATAVEVAVLEFDDDAGDVLEGIATGYGYVKGLADR